MNIQTLLLYGLAALVGGGVGVLGHAWWLHQKSNTVLRLPSKWPLVSRVVINNEEHEVLKWLRNTFHDHLVMIKLPVLRFTIPINKGKNGGGQRWQELLNGVYCTFTVCTTDGHVVGCVDVPTKRGLSKANREFKEGLLSDCGVAYTILRSFDLPKGNALRIAFLGELEIDVEQEFRDTRSGGSTFHDDLESFTKHKRSEAKEAALKELNKNDALRPLQGEQGNGYRPDGTGAFGTNKSGRFATQWDDSFTQGDERVRSKLN